jgi:hypothetical protein
VEENVTGCGYGYVIDKVPLREHQPTILLIAVVATASTSDLDACRRRKITVCKPELCAFVPEHAQRLILRCVVICLIFVPRLISAWHRAEQFCLLDYPTRPVRCNAELWLWNARA